jgi:hypothetical protein
MTLGKYTKTPAERKRYQIDFSEWLDTGETIITFSYSSTPVDASPVIIDEYAIAADGLSVGFYASGGVLGSNYKIDVLASTSGGQEKEEIILFSVRAAA